MTGRRVMFVLPRADWIAANESLIAMLGDDADVRVTVVAPRGFAAPPSFGRAAVIPPGQPVEAPLRTEPCGHTCQQISRIDAVVVRKGDGVSRENRQNRVPRGGQSGLGTVPFDRERPVPRQDRRDPVVVVLIDDQDAKRSMRLSIE